MIQRTCPHQHQPSTGKVEPKRMKLRVPHPSSVFLLDGWETTNANRRPSGLSRHFFLVTHRLCQPTGDETAGAPSGRPLGRTSLSLSDGWKTTKANHRNRVFPSSVLFLISRPPALPTRGRMKRCPQQRPPTCQLAIPRSGANLLSVVQKSTTPFHLELPNLK